MLQGFHRRKCSGHRADHGTNFGGFGSARLKNREESSAAAAQKLPRNERSEPMLLVADREQRQSLTETPAGEHLAVFCHLVYGVHKSHRTGTVVSFESPVDPIAYH